ncbi:uncharacterized protein LOC120394901 isoform X2 [Mauremys reevesii]|uniref:uncharacterized protein LOC120394901 isoform X2 n=1 Tax=Mauremys reevesii TaxID=260615 RepID=UPI00193EFADE|nr:uncharacterized protein LOC120394901 isoform X2 [Mauremys reevesii]
MMLLLLAPLLLLALARGVWGEREKPKFCREVTECFTFDLICNSSDYEARLYPPSAWVSTRVNNTYTAAKTTGFWRLFRYIQGRNQLGVKIPMTSPVLTRVDQAAGETQEFTISFLLPAAWQGDPPQPTQPVPHEAVRPPQRGLAPGMGWPGLYPRVRPPSVTHCHRSPTRNEKPSSLFCPP